MFVWTHSLDIHTCCDSISSASFSMLAFMFSTPDDFATFILCNRLSIVFWVTSSNSNSELELAMLGLLSYLPLIILVWGLVPTFIKKSLMKSGIFASSTLSSGP